MVPFRLLVRFKVFQLVGVAALAVPINTFLGTVSGIQLAMASSLLVGCGVVSTALWFFSRRYLGEIAVLQAPGSQPQLQFSTLDFWGNRKDNLISIEDLVPPLEQLSSGSMVQVAEQPFIPIDVTGNNGRQYFISLRHGDLANKEDLLKLLKG
eukprot:jgi/Astpho2/5692/gw1.00079.264.1_t